VKKQLLAIAVATATTLSAQAEVANYESRQVRADVKNDPFNLGLGDIEGAKIRFKAVENGFEDTYELEQLIIDMRSSSDLVINEFDSSDNKRYFTAYTPGWVFRDLTIHGNIKDDLSEMSLTVSVTPDKRAENTYNHELAVITITQLTRTDPNPVVDVIRTSIKDKELTLKIFERKEAIDRYHSEDFYIEANWMGHGKKMIHTFLDDKEKLIALKLVETDYALYPELGQNYDIVVKYENSDGRTDSIKIGNLHQYLHDNFDLNDHHTPF
jgi:hypothetical protein